MNRRGRPPHPDVLTPREWEVLALLREELTDQTIADRLGISLDGAKYHVREILSKLGVSSRQEAAAWQPEERAPSRQWLALPLAARIAGALVVVAAVGGLGVLAWGVARTDSSTSEDSPGGTAISIGPKLPEPVDPPRLTRDQVLTHPAPRGEIAGVNAQASTLGAILRFLRQSEPTANPPIAFAGDDSTATAWLLTYVGYFNKFGGFEPIGPCCQTPDPGEIACRQSSIFFLENEGLAMSGPTGGAQGGTDLPDEACRRGELTRELAIVLGSQMEPWIDIQPDPPVPTAERMTLDEALVAIQKRGGERPRQRVDAPGKTPVWLVTLSGAFFGAEGTIPEDGTTPRPTTTISCADRFAIVDIEQRAPIYTTESQSDACD